LLEAARAHDVSFRPGVRFSSQGGLGNAMRLCFAYYDQARLAEGVARLAQVMCVARSSGIALSITSPTE
jgi:DNA-binding transcriptional MocR family regulator